MASTVGGWGSLQRPEVRAWIRSRLDVDLGADGRADTHCGAPGRGTSPLANAVNDVDGDGYLNAADTCPGTYNPCQEGTDLDGDGVDDDCDACPTTAVVATLRGRRGLADRDADGLPDACDCHPDRRDVTQDPDRDFVWSACDNCAETANPFQENADGDRTGDACDPCPLHAGLGIDNDADGVPDECDNCPRAFNPLQENCNADAEAVAALDAADPGGPRLFEPGQLEGQPGVGDVCEPLPCGETTMRTRVRPPPPGGFLETAMDEVRVDGLRAADPPAPGYEGWTGLRFCRCFGARADTADQRDRCKSLQSDGLTGRCVIGDARPYDLPDEPFTWRWVTADYRRAHPGRDPVPVTRLASPRTEVRAVYDQPTGALDLDARAYWREELDISRWASTFGEVISFDPTAPLRGVLWTHTPGDALGDFDLGTRALTSHYWSGGVSAPLRLRAPAPCYQSIGPLLGETPPSPAFGASFPRGWLGFPGRLGSSGALGFPGCIRQPLQPPSLRLPGGIADPGPLFDPDPAAVFGGSSGRWAAAAEPPGWLPPGGPLYVLLAPGGAFVERVVVRRADGRLGAQVKPPPPPCDNPNGCGSPTAATAGGTTPSQAATAGGADPVAVLSARRAALWVLPRDGVGALRLFDLPAGTSRVLAPPDSLLVGHVLAATYAPALDSLLVLDEVGRGPSARRGRHRGAARRRQVRLLRLDPLGGGGEVVGRWPRVAFTRRFAMGTDPAGALWIAASAEHAGLHMVVRVDLSGRRPRVLGFNLGRGVLRSRALRSDRRGASLVVADARGRERLVGYATEALWPARARDLRRCF